MDWLKLVQIVVSVVVAVSAVANYLVMVSIKLKVTELNSTLREWARSLFAERQTVEQLAARVHELELRRQIQSEPYSR